MTGTGTQTQTQTWTTGVTTIALLVLRTGELTNILASYVNYIFFENNKKYFNFCQLYFFWKIRKNILAPPQSKLSSGTMRTVQIQINLYGKLQKLIRAFIINSYILQYQLIGNVKRKSAFEHLQNAPIQIILCMHKVSSGHLFSIHTFVVSNDSVSGQ